MQLMASGGIGPRRMAYVFLLPNMILFSLFVFLPVGLAFAYAFTGGTNLLIGDRPWVGLENFISLFDCEEYR